VPYGNFTPLERRWSQLDGQGAVSTSTCCKSPTTGAWVVLTKIRLADDTLEVFVNGHPLEDKDVLRWLDIIRNPNTKRHTP
jgi:hypothetical protein